MEEEGSGPKLFTTSQQGERRRKTACHPKMTVKTVQPINVVLMLP